MKKRTAYSGSAVKRYDTLVRLGFTQKSGFSDIVMREISKVVMKKRSAVTVVSDPNGAYLSKKPTKLQKTEHNWLLHSNHNQMKYSRQRTNCNECYQKDSKTQRKKRL